MSRTVTIPIAGMNCDHCVATVRHALEAVPGVESATVDLREGKADVTLASAMIEDSLLGKAVESAGYRVATEPHPPSSVPSSPMIVSIGPAPSHPEKWGQAAGEFPTEACQL